MISIHRLFSAPEIPGVTGWQRFAARVSHVADKLATLTVGAAFVSGTADAWRRRCDQDRAPAFNGSVALVAHVFYADLVGEIRACHARLPAGSALIVTTPPENIETVERALEGMPATRIVPAVNRGRDIAPFISLLDAGGLDGFDVVLKLHTKRSPHLRDGEIRRRLLYAMLAGSRRCVARALAQFDDAATGLVGWRASWRASALFWMLNRPRVEALAARMGVQAPGVPAFFEGSMFWVRPKALARLRAMGLKLDEFEPEDGQVDGALHHAVERIFVLAATASGFSVRDDAGGLLAASSASAQRVGAATLPAR